MDADSALNGGSANSALNGVAGAYKNVQNVIGQQEAASKPAIQKFQQATAQPLPPQPVMKKAPTAPDAQEIQKDSQGWISALSAFAALIGSRGRARGTGALKAYAAGLKGIQDGNQQAFDNSYKKWKADTDAMLADNKAEVDKYNAILENRKLTESEAMQEMKMVAAEYENRTMLAMDTYHQAAALRDSIVKARVGAEVFIDKLDARAKEQQKIQDEKMEKYANDPGLQGLVKAYMSGVPVSALVKGWGGDAQAKAQAIQDAAQRQDPNFDWAQAHNQYMAQGSELRGIGTMAGKIELGGEMLEKSIPSMMKSAEKIGLTPSTDLNAVYETMLRHASSQDFQNFSTQLRATTSDYALFLGRGRQTVHSDQEALRILNETMGITSLQGFADAVAAERNNTSAAIGSLLKTPALPSAHGSPGASSGGDGWKIEPVGE